MLTEQPGDFLDRIASMDLYQPMIGVASDHWLSARLLGDFSSFFKSRHEVADFLFGSSCNASRVQGCDLTGRPAHGTTAQTHGFGKDTLSDSEVNRTA